MPLPDEINYALTNFPDFEYVTHSNHGANGYIVFGNHRILGTEVAIKTYYSESHADHEPAILADCDHTNIIAIHDARYDPNTQILYYMMEKCESDTTHFSFTQGTTIKTIITILQHLLCGLSHLHTRSQPVVHRDIKPDNILCKDGVFKICDLGSATTIDSGLAATNAGSILFTPPEAIGDQPIYDIKSDIYQVGVTGYKLLGGILHDNNLNAYLTNAENNQIANELDPYTKSTFIDSKIHTLIKKNRLLKWKKLHKIIPNKLIQILKKATSHHDTRYLSVAVFLADLQNIGPYCNCSIPAKNSIHLEYGNKSYTIVRDGHSYIATKNINTKRRILYTRSNDIESCYSKLKNHVHAKRDE